MVNYLVMVTAHRPDGFNMLFINIGYPVTDNDQQLIGNNQRDKHHLGHIPQAINIPFPEVTEQPVSPWFAERDGLFLEVPEEADLFNTIGSAGISGDSLVVVVPKRALPHPLVDATKVADTLLYAGIENAAVLDGGYDKWADEGESISSAIVEPKPVTYTGNLDKTMFVSKEYVRKKIGNAIIIDTREP
jgi:thiosulfate/3-mercaptopyruvate sulfurtransferase